MKNRILILLLALLLSIDIASSQSIKQQIDALFNEAYPADSPGASVLIAQDDEIIYRRSFGMANLELKVPMQPENVMELASITKQFTGVALLMLMEQDKLLLHDPLSKYIADYPRGHEITLHHLLNHTSGIVSYTNVLEFRSITRNDMTPMEIINIFKDLPLDFEPGEGYAYSNSGYILLGYIIEQVSGISYGDFIQKNIFDKLSMKNSYYGSKNKILPNRASGYQYYSGSYENAEYLSMTIPYAAGSLMSTVDDMFLWSKAIHHNMLISEKSKQLAFTNHTLKNGQHINYGYGWTIDELADMKSIEHTGGIFGFTTSGIYIPEKNIYSIVLTNLDDGRGPGALNLKATAIVLGKPIVERPAVILTEKQLKQWTGAYQFDDVIRFITFKEGTLYSAREDGRPFKLIPLSENEFQFDGSFSTLNFSTKNGKNQALFIDRIRKSVGIETDKKPKSEMEAITLSPEILAKYEGVYELQHSFQIEIKIEEDRIFAQATGQPQIEIFAENEYSFFLKVVDAQIVFNLDADGSTTSLTLFQGGQEIKGEKIK